MVVQVQDLKPIDPIDAPTVWRVGTPPMVPISEVVVNWVPCVERH